MGKVTISRIIKAIKKGNMPLSAVKDQTILDHIHNILGVDFVMPLSEEEVLALPFVYEHLPLRKNGTWQLWLDDGYLFMHSKEGELYAGSFELLLDYLEEGVIELETE